jgi:hypothetical protein
LAATLAAVPSDATVSKTRWLQSLLETPETEGVVEVPRFPANVPSGVVWSTPVKEAAPPTTAVDPPVIVTVIVAVPTAGAIKRKISTRGSVVAGPLCDPTEVKLVAPYVTPSVLVPTRTETPTKRTRFEPEFTVWDHARLDVLPLFAWLVLSTRIACPEATEP